MKVVQLLMYALLLTLFTAGIIFSTMASYTETSPLSYTVIGIFMTVLFIVYTAVLIKYRKRRIENHKENRA
jgi:high-affinity Fe2+/Pb2+ permease